jgi:hypothetical protein
MPEVTLAAVLVLAVGVVLVAVLVLIGILILVLVAVLVLILILVIHSLFLQYLSCGDLPLIQFTPKFRLYP